MKTAIPYVPDEFALETDTPLDTSTKLTLSLYAMSNPVPALAVAMEFLATEGIEISDKVYHKVVHDTAFLAASPHWGELVEDSFRQNGEGIIANAEMVYAAHRTFITTLVHNLRVRGHDIPVQSWEPEPLEIKEES